MYFSAVKLKFNKVYLKWMTNEDMDFMTYELVQKEVFVP